MDGFLRGQNFFSKNIARPIAGSSA